MLIGLTGRAARANISKHFYRNVASSANSLPSLTLYTGDDCQLCDVAKATLDEIRRDIDFDLKEYNIRDDTLPEIDRWRHAYQYGEDCRDDRSECTSLCSLI